jgi:predicted nucleotidyltransferase
MTVADRLKGIENAYLKLIELCKENYLDEAKKYYKTRQKMNNKLVKVQKKALNEIKKCLQDVLLDYHIMPASSFSARTLLIGESDIDLMIRIKNISLNDIVKVSNKLGNCGYIFKNIGTPNDEELRYFIHGKIMNDVEIEVKFRDYDGSQFIANLHEYLDKNLSIPQQMFTTYIKYLMKKENKKEEYWKFKLIYNEYGLYKIKSPSLIMPLV